MESFISTETLAMAMQIAPFVILAGVFYFILYRPQKNQEKAREALLSSIKRGDKVITIGGLHGVVNRVGDTTVDIEVANKVEMTFNRSAVGSIVGRE